MTVLAEREQLVQWINEAVQAGARLAPACGEADISIRTHQRWTHGDTVHADARPDAERPTPANKLSAEECALIIATGRAAAAVKRVATTHVAHAPNKVWCWDITYLPAAIRGDFFYLYLMLDLYSRKIVGWEIYAEESGENASTLLTRNCLAENIARQNKPLVLHADNGSPMKSSTLRATMQFLGVASSYSRPRVSDDNAYVESLFRTCKYRPDYPAQGFDSIEDARAWVQQFARWYNDEHRHSGIVFVTPTQRHEGAEIALLKQRHPQRWRGETRNWTPVKEVWLNPERQPKQKIQEEMKQAA